MKKLLLAFLLLFATIARAQAPAGEQLHIYLMTFGPGDEVWERFGHNAIVVEDNAQGYSIAYNWGMFSFNQPGFVARLMKGRMLYWMQGIDTQAMIAYYRDSLNRSIWLQELNLTPAERVQMRDFLDWNSRDENKFYRYDYYGDNCSTRVRDAIDRVTGGAVARALKPVVTGNTYRSHTQALTFHDPALYTGLMLAMGRRIDAPLNAWRETFIPMQMREWARKVTVRAPDGSAQPLVLSERTVFEASREPIATSAPRRVLFFTIVGFLVAGLLVGLARGGNRRVMTRALAFAVGLWCLLVGVFGTVIALLWTLTDHVVTYNNENVLQANSLSLLLLVLAPAALLGRVWALRWAAWIALFLAGCSTLGFMIQALPQFDQVNGDIIGLFMPIHGAIAYIIWRRWYTPLKELGRGPAPH